jgi:hypothetical protein
MSPALITSNRWNYSNIAASLPSFRASLILCLRDDACRLSILQKAFSGTEDLMYQPRPQARAEDGN